MKRAVAAALWLCIIALYAMSPASLPEEQPERRRAWQLLGIAFAITVIVTVVEAEL